MRFPPMFGIMIAVFSSVALAWQLEGPQLPLTAKRPAVDVYHGVKVSDDYGWLEDGKNPEVIAWSEAQDD